MQHGRVEEHPGHAFLRPIAVGQLAFPEQSNAACNGLLRLFPLISRPQQGHQLPTGHVHLTAVVRHGPSRQ
jgi:hypothetical protein